MSQQTSGSQIKLLIAEDDDGHAELIMEQLGFCGVRNPRIRLRDGQEVINYFFGNNNRPPETDDEGCILLLDIRMPKVDGVEVLRRLKSDPARKKLPVIMFTSTSDPREVEKCYDLGCSGYVTKEACGNVSFLERIKRLAEFVEMLTVSDVPVQGTFAA